MVVLLVVEQEIEEEGERRKQQQLEGGLVGGSPHKGEGQNSDPQHSKKC